MRHTVIMRHDKFITSCDIRFHGQLLKGKTFVHRTADELATVDCQVCRDKIFSLKQIARQRGERGGRCIFIDIEEDNQKAYAIPESKRRPLLNAEGDE